MYLIGSIADCFRFQSGCSQSNKAMNMPSFEITAQKLCTEPIGGVAPLKRKPNTANHGPQRFGLSKDCLEWQTICMRGPCMCCTLHSL